MTIVGVNYAPEPTGIAPYTTGIAEGLAALGYQVTVLTSYPHYPSWTKPRGVPRHRTEYHCGVTVKRSRHYVPTDPKPLSRLAFEIAYGARSMERKLDRPDAVICVSPALLASAMVLVRAWLGPSRPAVGLVMQDLYHRGITETGTGRPASARAIQSIESWVARKADGVSVIHDRFKRELVSTLGVDSRRVTVIRNWSHADDPEPFDERAFRQSLGWTDQETVVLHSGAMGVKQGLENVVAAARLAYERGLPIRFVLMGDGSRRAQLETAAGGLPTLQFIDPLPDEAFRRALRVADILLVNELPGVAEMAVPSKLTSYFAAGKPVLAATSALGTAAEEVTNARAGVRVDPDDPGELLAGVLNLRADPTACATLGQNGREYSERVLSRSAAIASYDQWVRELVERRQHREK